MPSLENTFITPICCLTKPNIKVLNVAMCGWRGAGVIHDASAIWLSTYVDVVCNVVTNAQALLLCIPLPLQPRAGLKEPDVHCSAQSKEGKENLRS